MLKSSETVNALVKAKARIGTPGLWCKNVVSAGMKRCMVGAFETGNMSDACTDALRNAICRLYPRRPPWIASFNDCAATTHADVMRVFDEAIHTAE